MISTQYRTAHSALVQLDGMLARSEAGHEHSRRSGSLRTKRHVRLAGSAGSDDSVKKVLPRTTAFESVVLNRTWDSVASEGCERNEGQLAASGVTPSDTTHSIDLADALQAGFDGHRLIPKRNRCFELENRARRVPSSSAEGRSDGQCGPFGVVDVLRARMSAGHRSKASELSVPAEQTPIASRCASWCRLGADRRLVNYSRSCHPSLRSSRPCQAD